jgi:hypothetical protein
MCGTFFVNAQDLIIMRDGNVIEAKVTEISPALISYKSFNNLDGPIIIVSKVNVLSIRYENGVLEIINDTPVTLQKNVQDERHKVTAMNPEKLNFSISADFPGFLLLGPSLSAELTKGGFFFFVDLRFPTLGLISSGSSEYWETFGISLYFNYFWHSRNGGFYLGGLLEYSVGKHSYQKSYWVDDSYYNGWYYQNNGYYNYVTEYESVDNFGIALNIGYKLVTKSGIYFRTGANVGYKFSSSSGYVNPLILRPNLMFGYNFGKK